MEQLVNSCALFEQWLAVLYQHYIEGETFKVQTIIDSELREKALAWVNSQRKT